MPQPDAPAANPPTSLVTHLPDGSHLGLVARIDDALRDVRSVAAQLEATAAALRGRGAPPDYRVVQALGDCHRKFLKLRQEALTATPGAPRPLPRLDDLVDLREWVAAAGPVDTVPSEPPAVAVVTPPPPQTEVPPPQAEAPGVPAETEHPQAADSGESDPHAPTAVETPSASFGTAVSASPEPDGEAPEAFGHVSPHPADEVTPAEPAVPTPLDVTATEPPPGHVESAVPWVTSTVTDAIPAPEPAAPVEVTPSPPEPATTDGARGAALVLLDQVARIVTRDGGDLPALLDCQEHAGRLREVVAGAGGEGLPAEALGLATGEHPLVSLVTAVRADDSLTDAEWAALHATVSEAYGRTMAVAIARRRLVFRAD